VPSERPGGTDVIAAAAATRRGTAPLRRPAGWLLLAIVTLGHLLLSAELMEDSFGWGQEAKPPPRIEVAFVRELAQAAPPAAAARPPAPPAQRRLAAVAAAAVVAETPRPAASAPAAAASAAVLAALPRASAPPEPQLALASPPPASTAQSAAPELPPASAAATPDPIPPLPTPMAPMAPAEPAAAVTPAPAAASVPALSTANAAVAPSFDWPPSTRLTYTLNGHYRGPIEGGQARVEWLRSGNRYQVHLEASVGFAFSRHIVSEGELTERGLTPRRFDGEQKLMFRTPRRWSQQFGPERVTLGDGREVETMAGVQDEASQFVQLTWLFTTRPELLRVGQAIEVPLAINRRLDRWTYDVKEMQTLHLTFGTVDTFYVKPRREARGGDMTAEIWFAPSLQYLPVRILIRQDASSYIDLTLDKPPLQAVR